MRENYILWFLHCLLLMKYYMAAAVQVGVKEEAAIPVTTLSPPEGNTTFLEGATWCVAHGGVAQIDLQNALDWACGLGSADCGPIQDGGPCFQPNNLVAHASFAFNNYYQQNGNSDVACNFGGTAILTKHDPSYEKCMFSSPGSVHSLATRPFKHFASSMMWNGLGWILLLLYLGR